MTYSDNVKAKYISKLLNDVQDLGKIGNLRLLRGQPASVTFNLCQKMLDLL